MSDDPNSVSTKSDLDGLGAAARSVPSSKRPLTTHEHQLLLRELHLALQRCGLPGTLRLLGNDVIEWEHPRGVERSSIPSFAYRATRLTSAELERNCREFARQLANSRGGRDAKAKRRAWLPSEGHFGLAFALVALGALAYFVFGGGSAEPVARFRNATPAELTCAEIARSYQTTGRISPEHLDRLELHLVVAARGTGEPLDALQGFSDYFRKGASRFGVSSPKLGRVPVKLVRSKPTARGETLRVLDIDYGEGSARSLEDASLDPSTELVTPLSDLGTTVAALVSRCPSSQLSVESVWFYGESEASLLAGSLLFADGLSETPWLAEPFLHPPSEKETNPAFAFLTLRETFSGPIDSQAPFSIENHAPGFVLRVAKAERPVFLGKVRGLILEKRLGSRR